MDARAVFAAIIGVAIAAAVDSRAGKRQWWGVSAFCAFGTAVELGIVTEGNHSRSEHNVVFAVEAVLIAFWVVATGMLALRRDRR